MGLHAAQQRGEPLWPDAAALQSTSGGPQADPALPQVPSPGCPQPSGDPAFRWVSTLSMHMRFECGLTQSAIWWNGSCRAQEQLSCAACVMASVVCRGGATI